MLGTGLQELLALAVVAAVVAWVLYRRLRRKGGDESPGCHDAAPAAKEEQTIHFYRRGDQPPRDD